LRAGGAAAGAQKSADVPPAVAAPAPSSPYALSVPMQPPVSGFQVLIDRYRDEGGGRTVRGALPVDVTFPSMGPSLFMASELTAEAHAPSFELTIRRIK
jgi:hypothetical protein